MFPLGIVPPSSGSLAAYCLLLPGKQLHLSALLAAKKFRGKGNKEAAVAAFQELEEAGLGQVEVEESRRGTTAVGFSKYNMHVCVESQGKNVKTFFLLHIPALQSSKLAPINF